MTDEKEIPVEAVEGEILPAKKGGRPKTGRKPPQRFRSGSKKPNTRKLVWLDSARVLDLLAYQRLRDAHLGARKIRKALGTTVATAQKLMNGTHWQQDPERVRIFNKARGGSIDPETGQPSAEDLAKFGVPHSLPSRHDSQGEKDLREIVKNTGVAPQMVDEAVRGLRLLSGAQEIGDLPGKVDTKWLQDSIDQTLGVVMTLMDPVRLAGSSTADLTRAASMLFEKRALLRGEPTAIVRNEQRGGLDAVARMLLAEVERRGITLDMAKGPGGYQEVTGG